MSVAATKASLRWLRGVVPEWAFSPDDNVETPVALHAGDHANGVTTTLKD